MKITRLRPILLAIVAAFALSALLFFLYRLSMADEPDIPARYVDVGSFRDGLARVGKESYSLRPSSQWSFSKGISSVVEKRMRFAYIDKTGKEIIPVNTSHASISIPENWKHSGRHESFDFHEGLAVVVAVANWQQRRGVIDKTGREVISSQFESCGFFQDGRARVEIKGKHGFIDKTGKIVIPAKYSYAEDFLEGFALVEINETQNYRDSKRGLIDKTGKEIIPIEYRYVARRFQDFAMVEKDGKWGIINTKGKVVAPPIFENCYPFSDNLSWVQEKWGGKWAFVDTKGKKVISTPYVASNYFQEGLAPVMTDRNRGYKWGFINGTGKLAIPCEYADATFFSDGLAAVKKDRKEGGKWGAIDKTGKLLIPFQYDEKFYFLNGAATVIKNGKYGLIDKTGKELVEAKYEKIEHELFNPIPLHEGYVPVKKGDNWGFVKLKTPFPPLKSILLQPQERN